MSIPLIPPRYPVGLWGDVAIDVAAWDAVSAPVDLSVACLFEREAPGTVLHGGAGHLDQALGGRLSLLRGTGGFNAELMDRLVWNGPPAPVKAATLLVMGLGDPLSYSSRTMRRAVRAAVDEAERMGAASAAFAPSLLDAGLRGDQTVGAGADMVAGLVESLIAQGRRTSAGLGQPLRLKTWTFDANGAHAEAVALEFRAALEALR